MLSSASRPTSPAVACDDSISRSLRPFGLPMLPPTPETSRRCVHRRRGQRSRVSVMTNAVMLCDRCRCRRTACRAPDDDDQLADERSSSDRKLPLGACDRRPVRRSRLPVIAAPPLASRSMLVPKTFASASPVPAFRASTIEPVSVTSETSAVRPHGVELQVPSVSVRKMPASRPRGDPTRSARRCRCSRRRWSRGSSPACRCRRSTRPVPAVIVMFTP